MDPVDLKRKEKLKQNIGHLCERIVQGQAAERNASIKWQLTLRVVSILLTSLGSVGVIVDKAATNLPGQTGWAFWGSVILLLFGILTQIANEFQVAQRAADSKILYERCNIFKTQLQNCLIASDPTDDVQKLLDDINKLIVEEKYNRVLPTMTKGIRQKCEELSSDLFARYNQGWELLMRQKKNPAEQA
jgi:hypothetical protein